MNLSDILNPFEIIFPGENYFPRGKCIGFCPYLKEFRWKKKREIYFENIFMKMFSK